MTVLELFISLYHFVLQYRNRVCVGGGGGVGNVRFRYSAVTSVHCFVFVVIKLFTRGLCTITFHQFLMLF